MIADKTYIDQEIGIHKAVLDLAEKAHDGDSLEPCEPDHGARPRNSLLLSRS